MAIHQRHASRTLEDSRSPASCVVQGGKVLGQGRGLGLEQNPLGSKAIQEARLQVDPQRSADVSAGVLNDQWNLDRAGNAAEIVEQLAGKSGRGHRRRGHHRRSAALLGVPGEGFRQDGAFRAHADHHGPASSHRSADSLGHRPSLVARQAQNLRDHRHDHAARALREHPVDLDFERRQVERLVGVVGHLHHGQDSAEPLP
jgi:hypothetical protein